tara:strand:- start:8 stop:643 length:636 start_codon:yes stop_codon:yes gene_type:complete
MNKEYLHRNGVIINGNWKQKDDPDLISPTINGKNLFEYIISSLRQHINKLPTSYDLPEEKKMYIQIIANDSSSNYLFEDGPQELTPKNKITAINYLNNLEAETQAAINPWDDICDALESEYIGQLIISSAWKPSTTLASNNQPCAGIMEGEFSEIINEYNQFTRSKSGTGSLAIDSISLFNNYCEKSKNASNNNWLGTISKGPESNCIHIK